MMKVTLAALLTNTMAVATALSLIGRTAVGGEDWDKDWTALTVASNGAWDSARHTSRVTAMTQALTQCRDRAGSSSGCGSLTTTVRGAWSVAYACGTETFIVTATTLREAHLSAINREIELRDFERVDIVDCRQIVAIAPDGAPVSAQIPGAVIPLLPEAPEFTSSDR